MNAPASPEIGLSIEANGLQTNYHDQGQGTNLMLIHGSGPGVSAWANWRLVIPGLQTIPCGCPRHGGLRFH